MKPNCYTCQHRASVPGDCHSECRHPSVWDRREIYKGMVIGLYFSMGACVMGVTGDPHGMTSGWFDWPMNFDPVWLLTCDGYKDRGG